MNVRQITLAIALYAVASGAAFAQATDWSGFYVGGNLGHARGSSDRIVSPDYSATGYFSASSTPAIAASSVGSVDPNGITFGVAGGYNHQNGAMVFGFEIDVNSLNGDDSRSATGTYPCCAPTAYTVNETTEISRLMSARFRLGYAHNQSLFYVTAGHARTKIEMRDTFTDTFASATESFSGSRTKGAFIYGLGYEHDLKNQWSIKAEYLRADFGTVTGTSTNLNAIATPFPSNVFHHSAGLDLDVFRIGFNYRF
ncbi:outer membrane protein [Arenimonas oryziterrae]|uniref:Outer membrane protein beta-barrel domain-containing protein n=1 Tax=Arenimonas oryziterrae DSM 21050 = YC6267 TaxID=1121015 RepID=A0A091APP5_9GAMM|nr:outer membrane beta-barrel protein [Arenimonas oryziterrae]KFN41351.1 hypothetical protein N789_05615 [Arenimonas oryziterrae DSM 21050 = YC6267]